MERTFISNKNERGRREGEKVECKTTFSVIYGLFPVKKICVAIVVGSHRHCKKFNVNTIVQLPVKYLSAFQVDI